MTQDRSPASSIRVGHRERDAVAELLQAAAADGRLSLSELDERLEAALSAVTYADLEPLIADLSVELPWQSDQAPAAAHPVPTRPPGPPPPGYSREDPLRLDGGVSTEKRQGDWIVPPFIRIVQGVGSVKVNCLQATPAASLIELEVIGGAGSVILVLPDGWGVEADRLSKGWGSKTVKVPRQPAAGKPLLVFYGGLGMGTFKVRPANSWEQRRLADRG